MKTISIDSIQSSPLEMNPYNEEARQLADAMIAQFQFSLTRGDKSLVELSGDLALAILLRQYADGSLMGIAAFTFLRNLADKKTASPVQKIEQRNTYDVRAMIQETIGAAPDVLDSLSSLAEQRRLEIMERLKTDNTLRLQAQKPAG